VSLFVLPQLCVSSKACLPHSDAALAPCGLNDAVNQCLPVWKENNTKVIFVIQVPKLSTHVTSGSDVEGHQIHGTLLRHLFHLRKSIVTTSSGLGHSNVASIAFASLMISTVLRLGLADMFGNVVEGVVSNHQV
jgi:hypothetical protein